MRRTFVSQCILGAMFFFLSTNFSINDVLAGPAKKILLILPHPDDETMIRSVIMRWVEAGNTVSAIYLTQGEGGRDQRWGDQVFSGLEQKKKSAELAQTRMDELKLAAHRYGYKNLDELKVPDDAIRDPSTHLPTRDASLFLSDRGPWNIKEIKNKIEAIANREKPDLVITFFPNQPGTHAHHQATALLVKQLYAEKHLGPKVEGVFGFYEEKVESGATESLEKARKRIEFPPQLLSLKNGLYRGKAYGEVGTEAALAYQSQLKGQTETFIRDWKDNPNEVLAVIESKRGLDPLLESLGSLLGLKVIQ